jgi:crotonobetaine/carnitine-CoA ligase
VTTFHDLLRDGARRYGSRTAVLFGDRSVGYEELLLRAEGLASGLGSVGVGHGDQLAIVMDNSLECVFAWLAASLIGCTDVPVNPQYRGELLRYLLHDPAVTTVICDADYLPQVAANADQLPSLQLVIVNGEASLVLPRRIRLIRYSDCAQGPAALFRTAESAAEHVILYTSGTTGPSKGVVHTQKSCLTLARYNAEVMRYDEHDRLLNFFPLYHQNARYTGVMAALCAGASIRIERKFSSSSFWRICDGDRTTAFNYLGSVLRLILNVTPAERVAGTHSLKKAFGAGSSPAVWEDYEQRLGIELVEVYGLSEAPMATVTWRGSDRPSPKGSAGRSSKLFEVAVVDAEDRLVEPGTAGEIVLRPKRTDAMMLGYHNKDAATVQAFRNLWFHSGDRGRLTADGDLFFEERSKDSLRRRGENISAWEVESILNQHPDVAESAVFALPSDDDADEEVAAALVLRRADADLARILKFAAERLPQYAVPTLLRVMSDLPRTPTEKVQKAELRRAGRNGCLTASDVANGRLRDRATQT